VAIISVPPDQLNPETLQTLIEEFVTRDGTDYGAMETSVEARVRQVRHLLACGEAVLAYDEAQEVCDIVLKKDFELYQSCLP
jgi:uncharacterized protein YheU (UPF0270 family)